MASLKQTTPRVKPRGKPDLEGQLLQQIRLHGLPIPTLQFRAIPSRRFRWDMAWTDHRLLLEVQGGVWTAGKHGRGSGILKDHEKLNLASAHGFRTIQVSATTIRNGLAVLWIIAALEGVGAI